MKENKGEEDMEDSWEYYSTHDGDTWDSIAYILLNDSKAMDYLQKWNEEFSEYFIFPAGITLRYKNLKIIDIDVPPWRR